MNKKDVLFTVVCVLAILTVIVYSALSAVLFKREQAVKNPYYFCDGDWTCCNTDNCDVSAKSIGGVSKAIDTYNPADNWRPGSAYHQNCVLPVQNGILNYGSSTAFNFSYLYENTTAPTGNPLPYAPGCTGPGGTGHCADPAINPQTPITSLVCPYVSLDSGGVTGAAGPLKSGTAGTGNSYTLTNSTNNWLNNPATPYISGLQTAGSTQPGNNYAFPYSGVSGTNKGAPTIGTGGFSNSANGSNTYVNMFYSNVPATGKQYAGGGNFV